MPSFDGDGDVQESAVDRFRKKLAEAESSGNDDDDESVEVPLSTKHDEDEDREVPVVSTRADKKRERGRLRDEAERLRTENMEMRERMARLEGAQSAMVAQRGKVDKTDDGDPYQDELAKLQEEHTQAYQTLQAKGQAATQADRDAYTKRARDIEAKKIDVGVSRVLAQRGIQANTPQAALRAMLEAENSDVYANPRAQQYAKAYFDMQVSMGQSDSKELFDRSMNAAREAFKMQPRSGPPTEARRRQLEGAPRGGSARQPEDSEESVTMTKPLRIMARAKYPGLSEKDAYVKWAKTVGPGFLADVARSKKG